MNLQFVTGVYAMLTYGTSYLCKPEHAVSELMEKASKEAYGKDIRGKVHSIGNTFFTKCEVSTHEAIKSIVFTYDALKYRCPVCSYRFKKEQNQNVKSLSTLGNMHPDDTNVFASNIIDK